MDPATLVIAALIYFATQAGQEISSRVASALGDAAAIPIKKLVEKISCDSAAKKAVQAAADNPDDKAAASAAKQHILRLEKTDPEVRKLMSEIAAFLPTLLDQMQELDAGHHAILQQVEQIAAVLITPTADRGQEYGVTVPPTRPSESATVPQMVASVSAGGSSIGDVKSALGVIADHLPIYASHLVACNLDEAVALLDLIFQGSSGPQTTDVISTAFQAREAAQLLAALLAHLEDGIDGYRNSH